MSTRERLQIIRDHEITALMGSPSYLLQLASQAEKECGVLFSPQAVEDVVHSFDQLTEYRITVSRRGPLDEVTLKAETNTQEASTEGLMRDLESALRLKTHLRFQIELCPPGTFTKQEIKTKRLIDLRKESSLPLRML